MYNRIKPSEVIGDQCKGYGPDCVGCPMEKDCEDEERALHDDLEDSMVNDEIANPAPNSKPTLAGNSSALCEVKVLYRNNLRNISSTLRYIADHIDKGTYGDVESAAFVLRRKANIDYAHIGSVEIFGIGEGNFDTSVVLLSQGLNQLLNQTPYDVCGCED